MPSVVEKLKEIASCYDETLGSLLTMTRVAYDRQAPTRSSLLRRLGGPDHELVLEDLDLVLPRLEEHPEPVALVRELRDRRRVRRVAQRPLRLRVDLRLALVHQRLELRGDHLRRGLRRLGRSGQSRPSFWRRRPRRNGDQKRRRRRGGVGPRPRSPVASLWSL